MIAAFFATLVAFASPNPYPTLAPSPSLSPPPFPPDGTYTYGFYRGARRVGGTTVVIERRASDNHFDVFESGSFGSVAIRLHGSLAYADLLPRPWDVTYAGVPLPTAGRAREKYGAVPRYTVRYEIDQDGSLNVIDGILGGDVWPLWNLPPGQRHVRYYTVLDRPFMAGMMSVPATLALRAETYVSPLSEAFPENLNQLQVAPLPAKTASSERWPNDLAIGTADFTLWYDPKTMIVHQASFKKPNVTVTLDRETPSTTAAISFGAP